MPCRARKPGTIPDDLGYFIGDENVPAISAVKIGFVGV